MSRALAETVVSGSLTNLEFLRRALVHPIFQKGKYTTSFIKDNADTLTNTKLLPPGIKDETEFRKLLALLSELENKTVETSQSANWWRNV